MSAFDLARLGSAPGTPSTASADQVTASARPARGAWQVSPLVDTAAFAFGWVPAMVALALLGGKLRARATIYIVVSVVSEIHRAFTFGYAFLAPEVRARSTWRFVWLPLAALGVILACPLVLRWEALRHPLTRSVLDELLEGAAIVAGAWNVYHVLAQKYGLLRVYARRQDGHAAPPWADRALVGSGILLVPAWLLPREADVVRTLIPSAAVDRALGLLVAAQRPLLVLALGALVAAVSAFTRAEWRNNRFGCRPRLVLAAGTVLVTLSFLAVRPLYAYLAFASAHAVEYMVFVAAFLDRRGRRVAGAADPLARALARPLLAYAAFGFGLGAFFLWAGPWLRVLRPAHGWTLLGVDGPDGWVRPFIIVSSVLHFYYDGLLWKRGRPEVARAL